MVLKKFPRVFEFNFVSQDPVKVKQAEFCLECMCQLLVAHPHFNYAVNILHAVTPILTSSCDTARAIVR